jgi:predicted acyl esterase
VVAGNRFWTERVAARDGVGLGTDVHLPDGPGPFPVILERTPYGRNQPSRSGPAPDARPIAYHLHGDGLLSETPPWPCSLTRTGPAVSFCRC